ncbi:MAG: PD40 domain-containing protein [Bacteroidia bacterium]|nr:PD40 domain-containing protein [Bacteroidia bacterium]
MSRIIVIFMLFSLSNIAQENPIPFLPDLFKGYPNVRDIAISPDGKEIYFTVDDLYSKVAVIAYMTKNESGWGQPKTVSFTGKYRDIEPAFTTNGDRLYFVSNRPLDTTSVKPKDYDIWYVDKIATGWSDPANLGAPINTEANEYYPSITSKGDIYFTAENDQAVGKEDIFVSRNENGVFLKPESLKGGVNTAYYEFNAFVAPDESFLIFTSQRPDEGLGGGDIYISYNKEGLWSNSEILEKINSPYLDFCPFVDFRTNTFYFTSRSTIVQSHYEESLNLDQFLGMYNSGEPKGLNRIYHIDLSEIVSKKD